MASEARSVRDFGTERIQLSGSLLPFEVWQLPDGRAGFWDSAVAKAAGAYVDLTVSGTVRIAKATSVVLLTGLPVYWDHSANVVTFRKVSDRDFFVGTVVEDAASNDPEVLVDLNVEPKYDLDLARDPFASVLAGTPAAGGFGYPVRLGGSQIFELTATNEAQKVDALSVDGFAIGANAIITGAFRVISDGAGTVVDVSMGVANGTHATDADSITAAMLIHLDANNTNINAESRDGTSTPVAATDTTTDYTEGSTLSCRKEFWFDMRDPADVQVYVDAVLVLGSTVFDVDAATTLFLLVHIEKSSSTDTYKLAIDWLRARFAEQ